MANGQAGFRAVWVLQFHSDTIGLINGFCLPRNPVQGVAVAAPKIVVASNNEKPLNGGNQPLYKLPRLAGRSPLVGITAGKAPNPVVRMVAYRAGQDAIGMVYGDLPMRH